MKYLSKTLISILLISLVIVSCKKDKDDTPPAAKNYFALNGVEYTLARGLLENYGMDADTNDGWDYDGYNLDLTLLSTGITIVNHGDTVYDIMGSGQVLYFEMFSSSGSFLDNGEYTFNVNQPIPIMSFDYAELSVNFDVNNPYNDWIEIASGIVTISRSGSTYQITINCIDKNGDNVTGSYTGTLQYFNWDDTKLMPAKSNF